MAGGAIDIVDLDGTSDREIPLPANLYLDSPAAWSPDGSLLAMGVYGSAVRSKDGIVKEFSVAENLVLDLHDQPPYANGLSMSPAAVRDNAEYRVQEFDIRTTGIDLPAGSLSGGNQQKVVLAKWLSTEPKVLIVDEPTRGIDVATKAEVHRLMSQLAAQGVAILAVSSELPEVLGMADRVLVMREGRIAADIPRAEATEESIIRAGTAEAA